MIQRFQTLFLAIITLIMVIFLFVNIWQKSNIEHSELVMLNAFSMVYSIDGSIKSEKQTFWLAGIAMLISLISLISIISYKNRMRQLQLGIVNSILIATILGLIIYHSFEGSSFISNGEKGSYGPGLLIPAIALIFNNLSNRFIRKDEELVRSSDRMR